ncbi:hypothetical protein L1887_59313 [Cichorium endivia]|nr:hypothetical protein L1887_59313 [Cichorium endivia]
MDYDKILVLGNGEVLEFGSPSELLQREHGEFRAMVEEQNKNVEENSVAQRIDVGARDLRATRLAWSPPEVAQRIAMQYITTQAGCSMCRVAAGARPTRHARAAPMSSIAGGRLLLTARPCSCSRRVAAIYAQHHHLTSTQSPSHLLRTGVDSSREADPYRPQHSDGEGEVRSDRCPIPAAPTHRSRCKGCKPPEQGPAQPRSTSARVFLAEQGCICICIRPGIQSTTMKAALRLGRKATSTKTSAQSLEPEREAAPRISDTVPRLPALSSDSAERSNELEDALGSLGGFSRLGLDDFMLASESEGQQQQQQLHASRSRPGEIPAESARESSSDAVPNGPNVSAAPKHDAEPSPIWKNNRNPNPNPDAEAEADAAAAPAPAAKNIVLAASAVSARLQGADRSSMGTPADADPGLTAVDPRNPHSLESSSDSSILPTPSTTALDDVDTLHPLTIQQFATDITARHSLASSAPES